MVMGLNRRNFIKVTSLGSGGILVSSMIGLQACSTADVDTWEPNFFIKIDQTGAITFTCPQSELGQGTSTGLAQILADELGADWNQIKIELADGSSEKFANTQGTGGSNGIRKLWVPLREAAAATREMLIQAAARKWKISIEDCYTKMGYVHQRDNVNKIPFGELLTSVKTEYPPTDLKFKDASDYEYIGSSPSGPKNKKIVTGALEYAIDVSVPDMVYARIKRSPVFGGRVKSFDSTKAREIKGVLDIFEVEPVPIPEEDDFLGGVRSGVAVIADSYWKAIQASELLDITWEDGPNEANNTDTVIADFEQKKSQVNPLNTRANLSVAKTISAAYKIPYQANACMEPLNTVAHHKGTEIEIWVGTQAPQMTRWRIAQFTGMPEASIVVHNKIAGGGFGRRFFTDFVEEAVILSRKVKKPVKLIWTREDTISTSKYHPYSIEYWSAEFDTRNRLLGFKNKGYFTRASNYPSYLYGKPIAFHESIPHMAKSVLPRASWRSVMAYPWGFAMESFMDEVAHEMARDPLELRLEYLQNADVSGLNRNPDSDYQLDAKRLKRTLEVAKEKANYKGTKQGQTGVGVSAIMYNYSYCSHIAEVSVENGRLKIHKFTSVVDCGRVINPSQVKSQIEGSIVWGLSALMKQVITVEEGKVQQSNFHDYEPLRMIDAPKIEVHIVETENLPTGVGEPGVPGVAPAVLNAIYNITGSRLREAPIEEALREQLETGVA